MIDRCNFLRTDTGWACSVCGRAIPVHTDIAPYARCGGTVPLWKPSHKLGDAVERMLSAVGVNKERVERWTGTAGKPGGCGCSKRKQTLNDLGDRVQTAGHNAAVLVGEMFKGKEPA